MERSNGGTRTRFLGVEIRFRSLRKLRARNLWRVAAGCAHAQRDGVCGADPEQNPTGNRSSQDQRIHLDGPWRDLPAGFGHWHRTYVRFSRWRESGVWERMATAMHGDADLEHLFLDSTSVRAHQPSSGAQKKRAVRKSGVRGVGRRQNCLWPSTPWAIRCASFSRPDRSPISTKPQRPLENPVSASGSEPSRAAKSPARLMFARAPTAGFARAGCG
ncbi:MAG TPA: hypothetical protein DIC59_15355 [Candidatus Competibacteraceae bacterium]|mgnify:CR=1 FL=1|nr:hypothetical protein [Candidatus Competibacteraceae bacterium]